MDQDLFVATNAPLWGRLRQLAGRRRPDGAEVDELIALYRVTSGHLGVAQEHHLDADLVVALTDLVAGARRRILARDRFSARSLLRLVVDEIPVALYEIRLWWTGMAAGFLLVASAIGLWIGHSVAARRSVMSDVGVALYSAPGGTFESYYSDHPNAFFGAQVWTNNVWVAVVALFTGVLVIPALWAMFSNALSLGIAAGVMGSVGRFDAFLYFILPHGFLELSCVFLAGAAGVRTGVAVIAPGALTRRQAFVVQGRRMAVVALALVPLLLVSALLEAYVTPSTLPTPIRVGLGLSALLAVVAIALTRGRAVALARR